MEKKVKLKDILKIFDESDKRIMSIQPRNVDEVKWKQAFLMQNLYWRAFLLTNIKAKRA